jgi:hypothetical protein
VGTRSRRLLSNEPHTTDTNLTFNLIDTVVASQESKPQPSPAHPPSRQTMSESAAGITAPELLELAPRLRSYLQPGIDQTWRTLGPAAAWLAGELEISRVAWEEACRCVGQERATVMVALVSAKNECDFTKSPAAYFGGDVAQGPRSWDPESRRQRLGVAQSTLA